jgi:hypothetical protein
MFCYTQYRIFISLWCEIQIRGKRSADGNPSWRILSGDSFGHPYAVHGGGDDSPRIARALSTGI